MVEESVCVTGLVMQALYSFQNFAHILTSAMHISDSNKF